MTKTAAQTGIVFRMARKKIITVEYVDDLTGDTLTEAQVNTVSFAWQNVQYEIDLSRKNADALAKLIKPYVAAGRRVSGGRGRPKRSGTRASTGSGRNPEQLQAIRDWAGKNGYDVAPRGRIKAEVIEAFDAAH